MAGRRSCGGCSKAVQWPHSCRVVAKNQLLTMPLTGMVSLVVPLVAPVVATPLRACARTRSVAPVSQTPRMLYYGRLIVAACAFAHQADPSFYSRAMKCAQ